MRELRLSIDKNLSSAQADLGSSFPLRTGMSRGPRLDDVLLSGSDPRFGEGSGSFELAMSNAASLLEAATLAL